MTMVAKGNRLGLHDSELKSKGIHYGRHRKRPFLDILGGTSITAS